MRTRTKAALIGAAALGAAAAGWGIKTAWHRTFDPFQQSVAQVEAELAKTTRFAGRNKVALERTAWFNDYIKAHASRTGVQESLLAAVVAHESRGSITARSPTGPRGLGTVCKTNRRKLWLGR